jgi:hypothetical protein
VKNDKGKLEEVFGSARRASESCWRPLRLLNRSGTRLEKVHKECFAQTVDGASIAPAAKSSVNFCTRKILLAGKNRSWPNNDSSYLQRIFEPLARKNNVLN